MNKKTGSVSNGYVEPTYLRVFSVAIVRREALILNMLSQRIGPQLLMIGQTGSDWCGSMALGAWKGFHTMDVSDQFINKYTFFWGVSEHPRATGWHVKASGTVIVWRIHAASS